ncbi:PadR family transcriptional regulator [Rhodoferax koreense]|uniref:PadR family transcriptional regulator n=1 Tax=Rhodoferax koreensis TaxID=1842727 RepID=A0A1P8JPY5_9BURK|nr:PadR family transcriptional regulator [Rhodoferax koreense]APW35827.1 PadR family transcriptional regulator [Rhodoferax koreense]
MHDFDHFSRGRHHGHAPHGAGLGGAPGDRGGRGGRGGGRVFGHGGLRLVLLQLIADKPSHGYELIKAIEERLNGAYTPSPGVVYPTLTLLEDLGYATVADSEGGRKLYSATAAGLDFLAANREAADALLARMNEAGSPGNGRPPQVVRALENFKLAVRMRLGRAPLTEDQANAFAAVLDTAAQNIERLP